MAGLGQNEKQRGWLATSELLSAADATHGCRIGRVSPNSDVSCSKNCVATPTQSRAKSSPMVGWQEVDIVEFCLDDRTNLIKRSSVDKSRSSLQLLLLVDQNDMYGPSTSISPCHSSCYPFPILRNH